MVLAAEACDSLPPGAPTVRMETLPAWDTSFLDRCWGRSPLRRNLRVEHSRAGPPGGLHSYPTGRLSITVALGKFFSLPCVRFLNLQWSKYPPQRSAGTSPHGHGVKGFVTPSAHRTREHTHT